MKALFTFLLSLSLAWGSAPAVATAHGGAGVGLVGTVQSVSKQRITNASIEVVYEPSGTVRTATSDAKGSFAISDLAVGGPYTVHVKQPDYQTQTVRNVFLVAGQTANGTFVLRPVGEVKATPAARTAAPATAAAEAEFKRNPYTYIKQCRIEPEAAVAAAPAPAPAPAPARAAYPARRPATRIAPPAPKGHYDPASGNYIYETGALTTLALPNGQQITGVGVNSTESLLHRFVADPAARVDTLDRTQGWLSFDRVYFETGKATLTPESRRQLRNIAALLRSYPNTRVKLGGYTDSTGTYQINRQLSEARARTAWVALSEMGVALSRIEARGYGPNYFVATNRTPEGRAMNRRLSVKVLAK